MAHRIRFSAFASGVALFAGLAGAAWAQDSTPAEAPAPGGAAPASGPIEELLITAERRESTVQETPIAISAFGDESMEEMGIWGVSELHYHVPNFFYTEGGGGSPITQISIRGVGNENVTAGGDPGVAYHVDGVYLARPDAAAIDFFDLERVEVLRGPQGTLYGRNATGGAINVVTKLPSDELEITADAGYGNYDWMRFRGAVNLPIARGLFSTRVAAVFEEHDGYLENEAPGSACRGCDDLDTEDLSAFRAHFLFTPGEDTEILGTVQYYWDRGPVGQKRLDAHPRPVFPGYDPYAPARPNSSDLREVSVDIEDDLDLWSRMFNLKTSHTFRGLGPIGDVTVTLLNSRQEADWTQRVDNDFSELPLTDTIWSSPSDQWLHELQVASASEGAFQWLIGAFYLDEDVAMEFFFQDVNFFRFENGGDIKTRSYAGFGEASYDFEEATGVPITVRGGVRYTYDEKLGDDFLSLTLGPIGTPVAPFDSFQIDDHWTRWTGRGVVEWRPTDDLMTYASYSWGYKSGGVLIGNRVIVTDANGTPIGVLPNVYDPEKIDAFEVGLKSQLAGDRLQANLALFQNDYEDLQVFILTGFGAVIENAASADVRGVELEILAAPTDALQLNLSAAYLHAVYDEYDSADPTNPLAGVQDLSDNRLNRSPRFAMSAGAQYEIALGDYGSLTPRVDFYWQDESFFRAYNLPRDRESDWERIDAKLSWRSQPSDWGQWSVEAFVHNATDKDAVMNISAGSGSLGFPAQGILHPPRTFGVVVGFEY